MRLLTAPLTREDAESLQLGELVALSGPILTARDEVHLRALKCLDKGQSVPVALQGAVLYHCGPIMKRTPDGWTVVAAGPTTSARMNALEPRFIRAFGTHAIIGKGGMSAEVSAAMHEQGCVYLAATGGAAVSLAEGLAQVTGIDWEDLGMAEAVWHFEAQNFGPLVVAMDSRGHSLYEQVRQGLKY